MITINKKISSLQNVFKIMKMKKETAFHQMKMGVTKQLFRAKLYLKLKPKYSPHVIDAIATAVT